MHCPAAKAWNVFVFLGFVLREICSVSFVVGWVVN